MTCGNHRPQPCATHTSASAAASLHGHDEDTAHTPHSTHKITHTSPLPGHQDVSRLCQALQHVSLRGVHTLGTQVLIKVSTLAADVDR